MQIIELMKLADWYTNIIVDGGIIEAYNDLRIAVDNNTRSPNKTPFENERDLLVEEIEQVDYNELTLEQIGLLDEMGIVDLLGQKGVNYIHAMMEKNSADIASIAQHLNEDYSTLTSAQNYFVDINNKLQDYFSEDSTDELSDDEVLIRVYFKDDASITSLEKFKDSGNDWYQIGRGIAMATDNAPEDIRVIGAEKGSVIIDLIAVVGIAGVFSRVVREVLDVIQRIMNIKKMKLEIENLQLQNERIAQDLEKEIDKEEKDGADRILKILCKELKIKSNDGEKKTALKKSIELLIKFTQDGGKLDFVHNELEEDDEQETDPELKALRGNMSLIDQNTSDIRELEKSIKLLTEGEAGIDEKEN